MDNQLGSGILASARVSVTVRRSDISGNYEGGTTAAGIALSDGSSLVLEDSVLSGNIAGGRFPPLGGAIYLEDSQATITRSTIDGNRAGSGGGIFARDSTLSLSA